MLQLIHIECKYLTGKHETNEIVIFSIRDPNILVDEQKTIVQIWISFFKYSRMVRNSNVGFEWAATTYVQQHSKTCLLSNSAQLSSHFNLVIKTLFLCWAFSFGLIIIQNVCNKLNENDFAVVAHRYSKEWKYFRRWSTKSQPFPIKKCRGLGIFFLVLTQQNQNNERKKSQQKSDGIRI